MCAAYASGDPEAFPARAQRSRARIATASLIGSSATARVWLVRRPAKGLLGGMAALPGGDWSDAPQRAPNAIGTVRHVFTHFSLDLHVVPRAEPAGEGWWQPLDGLGEAGLPTLYRRAAELALAALRDAPARRLEEGRTRP